MNMKGLYVTANDLNKLSSSDMLVQITNNFAITVIKRSGGEMLFPPMGRMIPSMGYFEIKNRTQAINDVTQVINIENWLQTEKTTFFTTCFQLFEH